MCIGYYSAQYQITILCVQKTLDIVCLPWSYSKASCFISYSAQIPQDVSSVIHTDDGTAAVSIVELGRLVSLC